MPDLLRRVAALAIVSALGVALLAPLSARSALPESAEADRLLVAAERASTLRRGPLEGRDRPATLTLLRTDRIAPENLGVESAPALPGVAAMEATLYLKPTPTPKPVVAPPAPPPPTNGNEIRGKASWYCHAVGTCPAGWGPQDAFVALPGALGGAGGRGIVGYVTVCKDRCVRLPVVDYCQCYWGTANQRVVDLSVAAWKAVSNTPTSAGTMTVTLRLEN